MHCLSSNVFRFIFYYSLQVVNCTELCKNYLEKKDSGGTKKEKSLNLSDFVNVGLGTFTTFVSSVMLDGKLYDLWFVIQYKLLC